MDDIAYFWLILLTAFVASLLGGLIARNRRRPLALRHIPAYKAMPLTVDEAIESNRQVHFSPGSAAIGQTSTLVAQAAMTIIYALAERQAFTNTTPLITVSDPVSLAAAQDAVRRAYLTHGNMANYGRTVPAIWFPQGERSLAFGAGIAMLSRTYAISSNIMVGGFGPELAYVGEASTRQRIFMIGHSSQLDGQAIAFAQSDLALLGEELFVGDAYLEPNNSSAIGRVIALDVLRWVVIAAIILVALVS